MSLIVHKTQYKPPHIHHVPSLHESMSTIVNLCHSNNLRLAESIMHHLFTTVKPTDMHPIFSHGITIAQMPTQHLIIKYLTLMGVYKCLERI